MSGAQDRVPPGTGTEPEHTTDRKQPLDVIMGSFQASVVAPPIIVEIFNGVSVGSRTNLVVVEPVVVVHAWEIRIRDLLSPTYWGRQLCQGIRPCRPGYHLLHFCHFPLLTNKQ